MDALGTLQLELTVDEHCSDFTNWWERTEGMRRGGFERFYPRPVDSHLVTLTRVASKLSFYISEIYIMSMTNRRFFLQFQELSYSMVTELCNILYYIDWLPEFGSGSNFLIRVFIFTHKNAIFNPKKLLPEFGSELREGGVIGFWKPDLVAL